MPAALGALDLLPLAEREVRLGSVRRRVLPALVLAIAMALVGFGVVPVEIAFFSAAVVIVALGGLKMREAYASVSRRIGGRDSHPVSRQARRVRGVVRLMP